MKIKIFVCLVTKFLLTDIKFIKKRKSSINLSKKYDKKLSDITILEALYLRKLDLGLIKLSINLTNSSKIRLLRLKKEKLNNFSQYDIMEVIFPAKYSLLREISSSKSNLFTLNREDYEKELKICSYIHKVLISVHIP